MLGNGPTQTSVLTPCVKLDHLDQDQYQITIASSATVADLKKALLEGKLTPKHRTQVEGLTKDTPLKMHDRR